MAPDAFYVEFGKLVRGYRSRLKLTQDDLADRVGLSRTSITNIEQGRQKVLLHQLFVLAESLGVTPDALLPSTQARPQPDLEEKLPGSLTDPQKDWVRRVMSSNPKEGGARDGKD
jgi:transcriptional regulator with XRE-family HTH domain